MQICMAGFRLGNTLSDNGSVTRGVCHMKTASLTGVNETHNILKTAEGAEQEMKMEQQIHWIQRALFP